MGRGEVNDKPAVACERCGKCCQTNLNAYVTDEDMERWKQEDREDILHILKSESAVWAGDRLVSAKDGVPLQSCPFLVWEKGKCSCAIYETRPRVCREYIPGSSLLCPQFERRELTHIITL